MGQQQNVQNDIEEGISDAICRIHFVIAHAEGKLDAQGAQAGGQHKRQYRNRIACHKVHEVPQHRRHHGKAGKADQYRIQTAAEHTFTVHIVFQTKPDNRIVDANRGNGNHQLTYINQGIHGTIFTCAQDVGIKRQHQEHKHLGGKCADGKNNGVAHQLFISVLRHSFLPYFPRFVM